MTMAQALVRHLAAQRTSLDDRELPLFGGVWAIFGHGNVPALGEALAGVRETLPTWRGQSEQGMVHAATAFAKQCRRRRVMACTSSVGPGATNMLTGAATAHVNRLPVLLLPGDVFAHRTGAPVLQELERAEDATVNVNDCFRPVSAYFDRLTRPEQLVTSLPRAIDTLVSPDGCGPATLCLPQDVQAERFDYPAWFFEPRVHRPLRLGADPERLREAARRIRAARRPVVVAGGGVHYADAVETLRAFARRVGVPVVETSAGKGALVHDDPLNAGGVGVVGASSANALVAESDLLIAIGTRLSDFTTGSRSVVGNVRVPQINVNVADLDAHKHAAFALRGDARRTLEELDAALAGHRVEDAWRERLDALRAAWRRTVEAAVAPPEAGSNRPPSDAQVTAAILDGCDPARDVLVVAAGSMPAEGMKLWHADHARGYHSEYGFSCMGYEIAGGVGVRMAEGAPADGGGEVYVVVGDGSYLMLNSDILTAVGLGQKLIIVVLDNRGFGCINRLQNACGGEPFNNLFDEGTASVAGGATAPAGSGPETDAPGANRADGDDGAGGYPKVDFAAHARALGARAEHVDGIDALHAALGRARESAATCCLVIDTNPVDSTGGGSWWQVGIPEVSDSATVLEARREWQDAARDAQPY